MNKFHPRVSVQEKNYSYPSNTGRYLSAKTSDSPNYDTKKVALIGDSTIDNGFWVQKNTPYNEKTETVSYQIASNLSERAYVGQPMEYQIANFAVDGATTNDVLNYVRLDKVLPPDEDHWRIHSVNQKNVLNNYKPDVVVVGVGGNNYREALESKLPRFIGGLDLYFEHTPQETHDAIKWQFREINNKLIDDYKKILKPMLDNDNTKRIVIMTQYYPELGSDLPYFIYKGFKHIANAHGEEDHLEYMKNTMEHLYTEIYKYVKENNNKGKDIIIADMASSISPMGENHLAQIEPNGRGSKLMGRIIADAISHEFNNVDEQHSTIAQIKLSLDGNHIERTIVPDETQKIEVRHLKEFFKQGRHNYFVPRTDDSLDDRVSKTYYIFAGRRIDIKNLGGFEYGLLDLTIIPILASYIWQFASDKNHNDLIRMLAYLISAPVLLAKTIAALCLTVAVMPLVLLTHLVAYVIKQEDPKPSRELNLDGQFLQQQAMRSSNRSACITSTNMNKDEIEKCHVNSAGITIFSPNETRYENKFVSSMDMDNKNITDNGKEMLICPITQDFMISPVITPDGNSYEEKAILKWVEKYGTDPLCRKALDSSSLRKNKIMSEISEKYREKHPDLNTVNASISTDDYVSVCVENFKNKLETIFIDSNLSDDTEDSDHGHKGSVI